MRNEPLIICLDMEGVLIPEIWINVAEKTGVEGLKWTTRDIGDYDELMKYRLSVLKREGIRLNSIMEVIDCIKPISGARKFLDDIRQHWPVVILSDTFLQFTPSILKKLNYPTLLCNTIHTDSDGFISGYKLRQEDGKKIATVMFQKMGLMVYAAGDSHNDLSMLKAADMATLFKAPDKIRAENPQYHQTNSYRDLFDSIKQFAEA